VRLFKLRFLLLILSVCGAFPAYVQASPQPSIEMFYDIDIGTKIISGTRKLGTKVNRFSFKAREENGLIIVGPRVIAKHIGDAKLANSHLFSFADPKLTQVRLSLPKG
jgi:hypothetical protein